MIKPIFTGLLAISSLVLVKANYDALRSPLPDLDSPGATKKVAVVKKVEEAGNYNPPVPRTLPNLYANYLFNADRHLEGAGQAEKDGEAGRDEAPHVNVYEVSYNGSLIYGTTRKALIAYPLDKRSRRGGSRLKVPKHATLTVELEDKVGGYTVSAIEQGKIVFSRSGETVEKTLFDPEKERSFSRNQSSRRVKSRKATSVAPKSRPTPSRATTKRPTPTRRTQPPPLPEGPGER